MKHVKKIFLPALLVIMTALILCIPSLAEEAVPEYAMTASGLYPSLNGQWGYMPLPNGGYTAIETISQLGITPQLTINPVYLGKTVRYCPGSSPDSFEWILNRDWDMQYGLDGYCVVFTTKDKSVNYTFDSYNGIMPQTPGTYYPCIKINTNNVPFSISPVAVNPRLNVTVNVAHADNPEWVAESSSLVLRCPDCGVVISSISLDEDVRYNLCVNQSVIPSVSTECKEGYTLPSYALIYEGTGDTDYPASDVCPTEAGTYTARVAILSVPGDISSATIESEVRSYTVESHEWNYSSSEYSLIANCSACGEHAEVTIDTSTVYEASRTYNGGVLDYDVFYEDNWSVQDNIAPYTVLFSGFETISKTSTSLYTDVFCKPSSTGNYTVRIALLSNPDEPSSAWLSSKEKPYYLADISINSVSETTYGPTEIMQFTEPELVGDFYRVGTLSELLWCLYNKNTTAKIYLTNDIVVNPITVRDDGTVQSASYLIYKWDGFGSESSPYTGEIRGNGYTIYGIYHPEASTHFAGFIDYGQDCRIDDLIVENSLIIDTDVGALMGRYASKNNIYMMGVVDGCSSINCYLNGISTAGGLVGWCSSTDRVGLTFRKCINTSTVCGPAKTGAGGILGKCENIYNLDISLTKNLGNVSCGSNDGYAGGLVGYMAIRSGEDYSAHISSCLNDGDISSSTYLGGIVGYIANLKNSCVLISNCASTGYLNRSTHQGGIVGYFVSDSIDYYASDYSPNSKVVFNGVYYYDASAPFGSGCKVNNINVTELTKSEYQNGFICTHYGHTPSTHWNMVGKADCTENGVLELRCAVCNSVLESQTIRAHGHRYEYGVCTFCNADEPLEDDFDGIGTVVGKTNVIIIAVIVAAFITAAVISYIIIKKKKKEQALNTDENNTKQ